MQRRLDNDCDGLADCSDPNCSGVGTCPVCGRSSTRWRSRSRCPTALDGDACSRPTRSAARRLPNCVRQRVPRSYTSTLHFIGFAPAQTLTDAANIQKVCVNMEHSLDPRSRRWSSSRPTARSSASQKSTVPPHDAQRDLPRPGERQRQRREPVPGVGADTAGRRPRRTPRCSTYANDDGDADARRDNGTSTSCRPGDYEAAGPVDRTSSARRSTATGRSASPTCGRSTTATCSSGRSRSIRRSSRTAPARSSSKLRVAR